MEGLTIGQLVARTGVAEGTLRMWERRHGFPTPQRLPSGHRRYDESEVELVRRVSADRAAGSSLAAAIVRARSARAGYPASVHALLRRQRPDLEARSLPKPVLLALTHAIEDESLSRAERPLLFASFQSQRFYRQSQRRWCELASGAELAVAFADFDRPRTPKGAPAEIPIDRGGPLTREWTVICCAPNHAVCLSAWEPLATTTDSPRRTFETIWTVEPQVVWEAAGICANLAAAQQPALIGEAVRARLHSDPGPPATEQLRLATAISNRALAYASST